MLLIPGIATYIKRGFVKEEEIDIQELTKAVQDDKHAFMCGLIAGRLVRRSKEDGHEERLGNKEIEDIAYELGMDHEKAREFIDKIITLYNLDWVSEKYALNCRMDEKSDK